MQSIIVHKSASRIPYAAEHSPVVATPACRRVLVVDDDAIVRRWVREALRGSHYVIAGEAATAAAAKTLIDRRSFDVILADYRLGSETAASLVRSLRLLGVGTPALIFTAWPVPGLNEVARESGAQGTLVKTGSASDLIKALDEVCDGRQRIDAHHPPQSRMPSLTTRERAVLGLIAEGMTNREIAGRLQVSVNSVKTLQARASAKLGTSRRTETVVVAKNRGLL